MKLRKHALVILSFSSVALSSVAQDVILTTTGESIQAKITEVTETAVKYYKFDNQSGPLYTKNTSGISKIAYQNGSTDEFNKKAIVLNDSLLNVSRTKPEELFKKGNRVFVELPDEASKEGGKYFIDQLEEWNYWRLVSDESEAHFIIEYNLDKQELGSRKAQIIFKTKERKEFKRSEDYWISGSAMNGFNAASAVAQKIANKYLKKEFR